MAAYHGRCGGQARPLFQHRAQCWLDLQGQYNIGVVEVEREKGAEITRRVKPADAVLSGNWRLG